LGRAGRYSPFIEAIEETYRWQGDYESLYTIPVV
jgi:hypothetical protein